MGSPLTTETQPAGLGAEGAKESAISLRQPPGAGATCAHVSAQPLVKQGGPRPCPPRDPTGGHPQAASLQEPLTEYPRGRRPRTGHSAPLAGQFHLQTSERRWAPWTPHVLGLFPKLPSSPQEILGQGDLGCCPPHRQQGAHLKCKVTPIKCKTQMKCKRSVYSSFCSCNEGALQTIHVLVPKRRLCDSLKGGCCITEVLWPE